jgi:hypothetical protein
MLVAGSDVEISYNKRMCSPCADIPGSSPNAARTPSAIHSPASNSCAISITFKIYDPAVFCVILTPTLPTALFYFSLEGLDYKVVDRDDVSGSQTSRSHPNIRYEKAKNPSYR